MSKNQKRQDFANQRFKEKILIYINDKFKNPEDVVNMDEVTTHLKQNYSELQRKPERDLLKQVKWHFDQITADVTGTNIQKGVFRKRDFDTKLHEEFVKGGMKKRDSKAASKEGDDQQTEKSGLATDWEEMNEQAGLEAGQKLISYKGTNSMNNMLPSVRDAHVEAAEKSEKRKQEAIDKDAEELLLKRQKVDGLKKFYEEQKMGAAMEEMLEKMLVHSKITYDDVGGMKETKKQLREMIEWPIKHKSIFGWLGVSPPKGILITGPPGSGKTLLAMAIAGSNPDIPFYKISGPEIVTGISGQSEEKIRNFFKGIAEKEPAIIFIDELDSIAGKRENAQKDLEVRIVAQIASCMDDLSQGEKQIVVIGCTSRPETIDSALRRAGRFERELSIGVPNEEERIDIMKILTKKMRLRETFVYEEMVKLTPGYVGADIQTLCKEASTIAVERVINGQDQKDKENDDDIDDLENIYIELDDFEKASKRVQPSAQREGFSTVPNTSWKDVGALINVREELQMSIVEPILNPARFLKVGLSAPAGVLLYGPPGCGKTLVARAVSNESKANFISIKGPELLNKYVGESEKAVRSLFKRAKSSAPCVIFFDELDSLVPKRGSEGNNSSERVVNQLLTEMDGLEDRKGVFVIAATNRPDIIDPAMLRPGRLDKLLYVPLPTKEDRFQILQTVTKKLPLAEDIKFERIANSEHCEGFSGADLSALIREAQMSALKRSMDQEENNSEQIMIGQQDFIAALSKVFPSVSKKDELIYRSLQTSLRKTRGNIEKEDKTPLDRVKNSV